MTASMSDIIFWKQLGADESPNAMRLNLKTPICVTNAVRSMLGRARGTCR